MFTLRQSLCQQLQAPQKPQALGSAVTVWDTHRANGSQVSPLRNAQFPGVWADESMVGVGVLGQHKIRLVWSPGLR